MTCEVIGRVLFAWWKMHSYLTVAAPQRLTSAWLLGWRLKGMSRGRPCLSTDTTVA